MSLPKKHETGTSMLDVLRSTSAVLTAGGNLVRFNRRTEQFELWVKGDLLLSSTSPSEVLDKFLTVIRELPDNA